MKHAAQALVEEVAARSGVPVAQTAAALDALLPLLAARLPSPVFGRLQRILTEDGEAPFLDGHPEPGPP
ncbi:hypothetical protein [Azospirillum agricola]|uniref:hypothetical protein n=1 Tax=Azospirillum agricola TaxID=1720247 RepID=UPI000A0F1FF2|nr:hypothetical protein [Azospirillum agricola]SMH34847.1 hypothetical protein SAMN02982994_0825 [Azospirillum lipoferum]